MISSGAVAATTAVTLSSLFQAPPGPATLILANASSGGTVYVGPGTGVTVNNGYPLVFGAPEPLTVPIPAGAPGQTWSAVASAGTVALRWTVTSPYGQTGTGTLD